MMSNLHILEELLHVKPATRAASLLYEDDAVLCNLLYDNIALVLRNPYLESDIAPSTIWRITVGVRMGLRLSNAICDATFWHPCEKTHAAASV